MTFSILGFDKENNEFGIAICSAIPCIGEYFAFGDGSCGVVAVQGACNPYDGQKALQLLKSGHHPDKVLDILQIEDADIQKRQIAIIDKFGNKACLTGLELYPLGERGHLIADNCIVSGNMLENIGSLEEMKKQFHSDEKKPLYLKLLESLKTGGQLGTDIRGRQSAALHVYSVKNDYAIIKINIDDDAQPIESLEIKTKKFIESFYKVIHYFPQRDGSQHNPEKGSEGEFIFRELKKHVSERDFNFK